MRVVISASVVCFLLAASTLAFAQTGEMLWPTTTRPTVVTENDRSAVELGVKFSSDVAGEVTGISFYKGPKNLGTHYGHLWTTAGTLLATITFTHETASGWQTALFSTPVQIAQGATYVASYHDPKGYYSDTVPYFTTPYVSSDLTVPVAGGVYKYCGSVGCFPNQTWNDSNYYVTPIFFRGGGGAQSISSVSLSNNSFTGGSSSGTVVGTIGVEMSPTSPAFSGALSLTGTDAASFQIAGMNLETNGTVPDGAYSINIIATQSGATGSPFTQPETITGNTVSAACPMGTTYADGCTAGSPSTATGAPSPQGTIQKPHALDIGSVVSLNVTPCTTTTSGCATPYTNTWPTYLNWTSSAGCSTPATGTIAVRNGGLAGTDYNYQIGGSGIEGLFTIANGGSGCSGPVTIPIPSGAGSGSGGSITGVVQTTRPPWNVAGVDYYVGIPAGTTLTGWDTIFATPACTTPNACSYGGASWTYSPSLSQLTCNGGTAVLDRIDWTTGTASLGGIYSSALPCNMTITNSKFGCMLSAPGSLLGIGEFNMQQSSTQTFVFKYNTLDYSACTPNSLTQGGVDFLTLGNQHQAVLPSIDIEYNLFYDLPNGVASFNLLGGGDVAFVRMRYNLMWNVAYFQGGYISGGQMNHMHIDQWGADSIPNLNGVDISYNTVAEEGADSGGEGFQIYGQGATSTQPVWQHPNFSNNTVLNVSCGCIGNFVDAGQVGDAAGQYVSGTNNSNYFNTTETNPWYVPSSMSPSQGGWTSSGNIDMKDGSTIAPQ